MKRTVLAIALGLAVSATVLASANTLGGIRASQLSAGTDLVAGCDTDGVDVDLSPELADGAYVVGTVTVSGIADACSGQTLTVTLSDLSGSTSATGEHVVTNLAIPDHQTVEVSLDVNLDASQVARASVVIHGGGPS